MTEPQRIPSFDVILNIMGRPKMFSAIDAESWISGLPKPRPEILKELEDAINDYLREQNINHTFRLRPDP
jgi:hypothetical protein